MNLTDINDAIETLSESDSTLSNVRNLASLYIVQDRLQNALKTQNNSVESELNDILPSYKKYCEIKRKFQLKELTEEAVHKALERVCKEVNEFLHILYSNTDTEKEREILKAQIRGI